MATISINGRITKDIKQRTVITSGGVAKTVYNMSIVVNTFTGGKEHAAFYNACLRESRYIGIFRLSKLMVH